jgi:hypothetical protein
LNVVRHSRARENTLRASGAREATPGHEGAGSRGAQGAGPRGRRGMGVNRRRGVDA